MAGSGVPHSGTGDGRRGPPLGTRDDRGGFVARPPDGKRPFTGFSATCGDVHERAPPRREADPHAAGSDAAGSYAGATLALSRTGGANADDRFGATGTLSPLTEGGALVVGGVAAGTVTRNSGGALLLTFSGANAGEDNIDAVLRQITYANLSRNPDASVDIHWVFSDGDAGTRGSGAQGACGALIAEGHTVVAIPLAGHAPLWRSACRARRA